MSMSVTDVASLILPFLSGVLLGAIFFGGLWWTVRKGLASPYPARWFLGSQLLRTTITVTGFYLVARSRWEGLLICLAGFLLARLIVTGLARGSVSRQPGVVSPQPGVASLGETRLHEADAQEANHAS